ncbi:MAG: AmmeMemoRadiSam system radical SAM enzyme [Desulfobacteraceae bacterium]|nr:AmmeMemoRadiSam system radical SAM enzyme [Desulfobacteraceae bacterium]
MEKQISRRDFLVRSGRCALFCAALDTFIPTTSQAGSANLEKGLLGRKLSPYFTKLDGKRIRCDLCPHQCEVDNGERGLCEVRENKDGQYYSLVYGNPCAVHSDPIEKKPFFHVLPTTRSFSIATAGCNFDCKFCQNWEISQARPDDTYNYNLSPENVVRSALKYGCKSIASTYVEPTIFFEYMLDIGILAGKKGLLKVMHSNGYINADPLKELCKNLDAACIDLKAFTDTYYRKITEGTLEPVLATLKRLKQHGIHTELVTLIVPGKNDDMKQIRAMCSWIRNELSPGVPLHFSRFYPQYKLKSLPPTPVATLEQARKTAMDAGLHYVYIGNVPGHEGEHTYCPKCEKLLIQRVGYHVQAINLKDGKCRYCEQAIPGIWKQ